MRGVSKDTLDCFQLSRSKHCQYSNDNQGQKSLLKWIKRQDIALVVFEATIAPIMVYFINHCRQRDRVCVACTRGRCLSSRFRGSIGKAETPLCKGEPTTGPTICRSHRKACQNRSCSFSVMRCIACQATDAAMLAKTGAVLNLPAQEPKSENINVIR